MISIEEEEENTLPKLSVKYLNNIVNAQEYRDRMYLTKFMNYIILLVAFLLFDKT